MAFESIATNEGQEIYLITFLTCMGVLFLLLIQYFNCDLSINIGKSIVYMLLFIPVSLGILGFVAVGIVLSGFFLPSYISDYNNSNNNRTNDWNKENRSSHYAVYATIVRRDAIFKVGIIWFVLVVITLFGIIYGIITRERIDLVCKDEFDDEIYADESHCNNINSKLGQECGGYSDSYGFGGTCEFKDSTDKLLYFTIYPMMIYVPLLIDYIILVLCYIKICQMKYAQAFVIAIPSMMCAFGVTVPSCFVSSIFYVIVKVFCAPWGSHDNNS